MGFARTLNFHLTGVLAGGSTARELRVSRRIARPFRVTNIVVRPVGGVQVGQFVDVLVGSDDSTSDVAVPGGYSLFETLNLGGPMPSQDQDVGLPVVENGLEVLGVGRVFEGDRVLKVVTRFSAPATILPILHVTVSILEGDAMAEPIVVRPPFPVPVPPPVDRPRPEPEPFPAPVPPPLFRPDGEPPPPVINPRPVWSIPVQLSNCVPLPPGTRPPLATGSGGGACYRAVGQEEWNRLQSQRNAELLAGLGAGYSQGRFGS